MNEPGKQTTNRKIAELRDMVLKDGILTEEVKVERGIEIRVIGFGESGDGTVVH